MEEYLGRCERCGGTQNIAGAHVFSQMGGGRENTVGGLKKSRGGRPGGTSTGTVLEGCYRPKAK